MCFQNSCILAIHLLFKVFKGDVTLPPVENPKKFGGHEIAKDTLARCTNWDSPFRLSDGSTFPLEQRVITPYSFTIASLMTERGLQSKQLYHAAVRNCRDFSYEHIFGWRFPGAKKTMIEQFQSNADEDYFDGSFIALLVHSLHPSNELPHESERMDTVTRCEYLPACNGRFKSGWDKCEVDPEYPLYCKHKQSRIGHGHLKNRAVKPINNRDFNRLCEFFGLEWVNEMDEKPKGDPTADDVAAFFLQFANVKLDTIQGFQNFIQDFKLQSRYECNPHKNVLEHMWNFGWLLRSFTNVRLSNLDGQKRWMCHCNFGQGITEFHQAIPLKFNELVNYNPTDNPTDQEVTKQQAQKDKTVIPMHCLKNISSWQVWGKNDTPKCTLVPLRLLPTMNIEEFCKIMREKYQDNKLIGLGCDHPTAVKNFVSKRRKLMHEGKETELWAASWK